MDGVLLAYFAVVLVFGVALISFGPLGWGIVYAVLALVGLLTL